MFALPAVSSASTVNVNIWPRMAGLGVMPHAPSTGASLGIPSPVSSMVTGVGSALRITAVASVTPT